MTATLLFGAAAVAASAIAIILAIDVVLAFRGGFQATISWHLYLLSIQFPIITALLAFFIGILFGHFWWNQLLNITVNTGCT